MNGNDGLLTIVEAKKYLCDHGIPAEGRSLQIRATKNDEPDDCRWPFEWIGDDCFIVRHELDKIIEQLPRWLFVIVNRDLESRCGYMAIPHIQSEFGLTRSEILGVVLDGRAPYIDRGDHLHPVLRYLVHRGSMFDLVRELAESGRSRTPGSISKEALVMSTGPLSLRQFHTQHGLVKSKLKALAEQGLLPLDSNGKTGTSTRYSVSQDAANHILADEELLAYLKNSRSKLADSLRKRLESGVIFEGEAPAPAPPPPSTTSSPPEPPQPAAPDPAPKPAPELSPVNDEQRNRAKQVVARSLLVVETFRAALARDADAYAAVYREFCK